MDKNFVLPKIFWGYDENNNELNYDFKELKNIFICGGTGSGKTNFLNIVLNQLVKVDEKNIQLYLFDPKTVELFNYKKYEHVAYYNDKGTIYFGLNKVIGEINNRYAMLKEQNTNDFDEYNAMQKNDANKLCFGVVIIDEVADILMLDEDKEQLLTILTKGSQVGIYVIATSQRCQNKEANKLFTTLFVGYKNKDKDKGFLQLLNQKEVDLTKLGEMYFVSPVNNYALQKIHIPYANNV